MEKEAAKPKDQSLSWNFLNSSFGLWLLSAIFITGLGSILAQHQTQEAEKLRHNQAQEAERLKKFELEQQEHQKTRDLVERLDLEIGYRISQAVQSLYLLVPNRGGCINNKQSALCKDQQQIVLDLVGGRTPKPSLFPEYGGYSTLALIGELSRHVQETEKFELRGVMNNMSGASLLFEGKAKEIPNPTALAKAILAKYALSRWDKGWYFMDCRGTNNPFC
jgi:hypothetical protein